MSTTVTKTLDQLLDEAVEKMPWLRRRVMKRRLRRKKNREAVIDELRLKLADDSRVQEMGMASMMLSEDVTGETPLPIDLDQLERLLQIIIEYLPTIIELIMAFF